MKQRVEYPDPDALCSVLAVLARLPPLVTSWEVESLKDQLAEASRAGLSAPGRRLLGEL